MAIFFTMHFLCRLSPSGIPSRSRVVRCLIPRSTISCSSALRALSGLKGLPISLQHLLFRWIVLVFDVIDDTAPLHAVYNIIMHYIQMDDLVSLIPRPHLRERVW